MYTLEEKRIIAKLGLSQFLQEESFVKVDEFGKYEKYWITEFNDLVTDKEKSTALYLVLHTLLHDSAWNDVHYIVNTALGYKEFWDNMDKIREEYDI